MGVNNRTSDVSVGVSAMRRYLPLLLLLLVAIPMLYQKPTFLHLSSDMSATTRKVPPILHYVWQTDKEHETLSLSSFMAISSGAIHLKPAKIRFQYRPTPPAGYWWDVLQTRLRQFNIELELVAARDVTEVFGKPVWVRAHKSDILRMEAIRDFGGVYGDLDVYFLQDFSSLYTHSTVLGEQAADAFGYAGGLCNALIVAEPHAPFIERWWDSYRDFDGHQWSVQSVDVPKQLAEKHPDELHVLNRYAMFWPLYYSTHLKMVHDTLDYNFNGQYAYHAWHNAMHDPMVKAERDYLANLDVQTVWQGNSSFTRMARTFLTQDIVNDAIQAHKNGVEL